jgi:hypothetical protein
VREGFELEAGAATGSAQLVDLCRAAINLKTLSIREAEGFSLDTADGRRYVQLQVSKTNGPPPRGGPFVLEIIATGPGATVEFREEARGAAIGNEGRIFEVIAERCRIAGEPVSREEIWEFRGHMSKRDAQAAWTALIECGAVIRHRDGQHGPSRFEPAPGGEELLAQLRGDEEENAGL